MLPKTTFPAVPRRRNFVKMEENFNVNKMHTWHRRRVSLFVSTPMNILYVDYIKTSLSLTFPGNFARMVKQFSF